MQALSWTWRASAVLAAATLLAAAWYPLATASPVGVNPTGDAAGDYVAVSGTGSATAGSDCDYGPLPVPPPCLGVLAVSLTGDASGGAVNVAGGPLRAGVEACAAAPGPSCVPDPALDAALDGAQATADREVDAAQGRANAAVDSAQRTLGSVGDAGQAAANNAVNLGQAAGNGAVDQGQRTLAEARADPAGFAGRAAAGAQHDAEALAALAVEVAGVLVDEAPVLVAQVQADAQALVDGAPGTVQGAVDRAGRIVDSLPDECVQAGDARCGLVAVSVLGSSEAHVLAVSGTGPASACQPELLCAAVSGTGPAQGYFAVSGTGPAQACEPGTDYLCTAASVAGPAQGDDYAVSVLGDAEGGDLAVSGTGHASGAIAVSGCDAAGLCL